MSATNKNLIVALCVTGALVAAWLSIPKMPPPADSVEERAVTRVDVPSAESSEVREPNVPHESEHPVAPVPVAQSADQDSASGRDSDESRDSGDPVAERQAAMNAAMSEAYALVPLFASEARDRTWAETAEAELSSRVAQAADLELTTLRIECRETVCRIDFTFPSREYLEKSGGDLALAAVSGTPGYETGGLVLVGDNGTLNYYVRLREPGG